jgi:flagellar FliL protein
MANVVKGEKKEKSLNMIIVILLVIIIVGLLGLAAGFYFFSIKGNNTSAMNTNTTKTSTTSENKGVSTLTFAVDDFLVNLSDEGGKRYIKVKVFVGYDNAKLSKELETKKPIIRDAANSVLRAKKTTDFTEKGTEDVKKELLTRINPILSEGKANNIYFYEILIQ